MNFKLPICFFGWTNFKWFITEVNKMYSSREVSFFSKKRVEGGIAFIILQGGMILYLHINISKMSMSEMLIWAGIECVICGYTLNKIEANNLPTGNSDNGSDDSKV